MDEQITKSDLCFVELALTNHNEVHIAELIQSTSVKLVFKRKTFQLTKISHLLPFHRGLN